MSSSNRALAALAGSQMTAMRVTLGNASLSNSSCFPPNSEKFDNPCNFSTWMRKTGDQSGSHRIGNTCHDDGDCFSRSFRCLSSRSASNKNDIDVELDQIGCEVRKPFFYSFGIAVLYKDVLSLD